MANIIIGVPDDIIQEAYERYQERESFRGIMDVITQYGYDEYTALSSIAEGIDDYIKENYIKNKKEIESMKNKEKEIKAEEGYQGWSNHATWVINLHLDNEQGTQETKREIVLETRNEDKEKWIYDASETLKSWVEDTMPELDPMWSDMLNGYFEEVDFREIAEYEINEIGYNEENEKNKGKDLKKEFE